MRDETAEGGSRQNPDAQPVDERDTMFARMARTPGTPQYEDYYGRRPELRPVDDAIRSLPPLLHPDGRHYDPRLAREAAAYFDRMDGTCMDGDAVRSWVEKIRSAHDRTGAIKEMILSLGSVGVGCAPLDKDFIYSHKGRFDEDYGRRIDLDHPSAIVFLVEMDFEAMQRAPLAQVLRESARQYYRAALISKTVEAVLQAVGQSAKAHYDAHYDVILPPLAVRAGLGELGRNNILIADRYGSRVRIGAVTTDLPLRYDAPVDLGVQRFCESCKKCASNCPSRSLSLGEMVEVRGVRKWPTRVESCHTFWRAVGTDCAICMTVCPFSHPNNPFHNSIRWMVQRFSWTHRAAVLLDDWAYGREWKHGGP